MVREEILDNDSHIPMVNDKFSSNLCQTILALVYIESLLRIFVGTCFLLTDIYTKKKFYRICKQVQK